MNIANYANANYLFDKKNSKEDAKFLRVVYKFCCDNYMIPESNKYGVVGHGVMEIEQALQNVTNYQLKYNNKKYRMWCDNKEESLNKYSDNNNIIYIDIPSYLNDENDKIDLKEYKQVIKCVDSTFTPYMYKNNNNRKNALKDADVYFISGNALLGYTHKIKLSFAFFNDEKLADSVQKDIHHITGGLLYKSIKYFEKKILNGDRLLNRYEKINKKRTKDINNIETIVNEYNVSNKTKKVIYTLEPGRKYIYITSKYKKNIKNFRNYYNESDHEYELNKALMPSVYMPLVDDGLFIRLK